MQQKRKICFIISSRAHYARLKSVLDEMKNHSSLQLQLVVGASALSSRYGDLTDTLRNDGFAVDHMFHAVVEGENPVTMAKSAGLAIIDLSSTFSNLKPDIVFVHADRHEMIAPAIAASYMNIPIAHNQGGEVTGTIDESVRHTITKLSHFHFTTNEETAERLKRLGENPDYIFITGCPSIDLIKKSNLSVSNVLFDNFGTNGPRFDLQKPFLLVLQHPVTTEYGQGFKQINETLQAISSLKMPTIWLWPNVDAGSDEISKGLRLFRDQHKPTHIHFFKNLPPEEYLRLLAHASVVIGNSSSFIREGSYLGSPAVMVGTRQEGRRVASNVVWVPYDNEQIKYAILQQLKHGRYSSSTIYGDGTAAKKIVAKLAVVEPPLQKRIMY